MPKRVEGKVAFCTAAGAGIGRATAIALAREGAKVIATDLNEALLAGLKEEGVAECAKLDARDTAAIAGAWPSGSARSTCCSTPRASCITARCSTAREEDWDFSFDLNVKSMHRTIKAFLPGMLAKGKGSIINIASTVGASKAAPNRYVYAATKAAVVGLTKAVAMDFIGKGIRCNCICPGTIETPSLGERVKALGEQVGGEDKARKMFIERQPMGRLGRAEEMAHVAVYLASDESDYMTGSCHLRRRRLHALSHLGLFRASHARAEQASAALEESQRRHAPLLRQLQFPVSPRCRSSIASRRPPKAGFKAIETGNPYEASAAEVASRLKANELDAGALQHAAGNASGGRTRTLGAGRPREGLRGRSGAGARATRRPPAASWSMSWRASCIRVRGARRSLPTSRRPRARPPVPASDLVIEPINRRDIPGYFLNKLAEARAIIYEVGEPNLGLQFDLYHRQVEDGDVAVALKEYAALTRHYQIANPPDRGEPDAGDLNYAWLLQGDRRQRLHRLRRLRIQAPARHRRRAQAGPRPAG